MGIVVPVAGTSRSESTSTGPADHLFVSLYLSTLLAEVLWIKMYVPNCAQVQK